MHDLTAEEHDVRYQDEKVGAASRSTFRELGHEGCRLSICGTKPLYLRLCLGESGLEFPVESVMRQPCGTRHDGESHAVGTMIKSGNPTHGWCGPMGC